MHEIVALYKFCTIIDTNKFQRLIKSQLSELQIVGTIILGNEGLNGTISGSTKSLKKAITIDPRKKSIPSSKGKL